MNETSDILTIPVVGNGSEKGLFGGNDRYIIPLYQRPYAWTEDQIVQLLQDIDGLSSNSDEHYYLGPLVVHRRKNGLLEVIDGQQRLTTLFLLLRTMQQANQLGEDACAHADDCIPDSFPLIFECRERSDKTLRHLGNLDDLDADSIEEPIRQGFRIIQDELSRLEYEGEGHIATFADKLQRVLLHRIEVPPHTDLNHYFEIMNSRGEQLEQHEVLKARLMSFLPNSKEKTTFATIWNACSDMSGYVQMHFKPEIRTQLFDGNWEEYPTDEKIGGLSWDNLDNSSCSILKAIDSETEWTGKSETDDREENSNRFESIVDFPHFLLHVLQVFMNNQNDGLLKPVQTDDQRLLETFKEAIGSDQKEKEKFSSDFIKCLLRCRYLFDRYIIKREFAGDSLDGSWSLKSLKKQGGQKGGAYYSESSLLKRGSSDKRTRRVLMMQACYRVSYTSPKTMGWITTVLSWLYANGNRYLPVGFEEACKDIGVKAVSPWVSSGHADHTEGVNTPHIVFNFLDYLLWEKRQGEVDFDFEFRTSVEHWYPQNPSKGTFKREPDVDHSGNDVDYFGNLCLVQRSTNSKFSNMNPIAKASTFKDMIDKGSLKLRIMRDITENEGHWGECQWEKHGEEMIKILRNECEGIST